MRNPTNYQMQLLLQELEPKVKDSRFWRRIVKDLKKPSRQRRIVNLYKINKCVKEGETIIVPGKVLSVGDLNKKVDIAALNFSSGAKEKITQANGKAMTIKELLQINPEGKKVRILG